MEQGPRWVMRSRRVAGWAAGLPLVLTCALGASLRGDTASTQPPAAVLSSFHPLDLAVLERPQRVEIEALAPPSVGDDEPSVVARVVLPASLHSAFLHALYTAVATPGMSAICMLPRHRLRVLGRGRAVEMLVSFRCGLLIVRGRTNGVAIRSEPLESFLDRALERHARVTRQGEEDGPWVPVDPGAKPPPVVPRWTLPEHGPRERW